MSVNAITPTVRSMRGRVEELRQIAENTLASVVPQFDRFALLDFPDHSNVGDSAIWLGETSYFRKIHHKHPNLVTSIIRHPMEETIRNLPDGLIFLHGGGNFGDVYPTHHEWREEFLRRTKGRPIIQLPQSIYFKDEQRIDETARVIAEHGNFTLLVRDHPSLKLAQERFDCRVELCPDMAFMLGPLERPNPATVDVFCLMRTDDEQSGYESLDVVRDGGLSIDVKDWLTENKAEIERLRSPGKLARLKAAKWGALPSSNYRNFGFHLMATNRLQRGLGMLSSGRWVLTDRLHAHILSLLLGLPHVALDNSYGKLSSFMHAWTSNVENVFTANNVVSAASIIKSHIKSEQSK